MNLAVRFHGDTENKMKLPPDWPSHVREIGDSTLLEPGETLMTVQEYDKYRADRMEKYIGWESYQKLSRWGKFLERLKSFF